MKSWKWIALGGVNLRNTRSMDGMETDFGRRSSVNGLGCRCVCLWSLACPEIGGAQAQAIIRNVEQTAIQMLNHHRHDWMNELQILYGYIQLGKLDKTVGSVERIKDRMATESRISKLGIPSLVLFTFIPYVQQQSAAQR